MVAKHTVLTFLCDSLKHIYYHNQTVSDKMRYKMQSIKTYCLTLPNTVAEKMKAVAIVFLAALAYSPLVSGEPAVKANGIFLNRQHYSSISVANGGPWGTWTWTDMCPEHFYAMGFSIKVTAACQSCEILVSAIGP